MFVSERAGAIARLAVLVASVGGMDLEADGESPKGPVETRLARSATALRMFRESAPATAQKLFDSAVCVVITPRRIPAETTSGAGGFLSCRSAPGRGWSSPAAILIENGGVVWQVAGVGMDVILLAPNRVSASRLEASTVILSADVNALPGPVRPDQIPPVNQYPVLFAYENLSAGISGIHLGGATLTEDRSANAVIYGKELSTVAVLKRNTKERSPIEVDDFLAALPVSSTEAAMKIETIPESQ